MAEKAEESTTRASGPAPQAAEEAYPIEQLRNNSTAIFGQPPFVVDGALAHAGITDPTVTKAALQTAIDNFLAQPDLGHPQGG